MDRRSFLKNAMIVSVAASVADGAIAAERYFPTKVDQSLFEGINRVRDPGQKTPLDKAMRRFSRTGVGQGRRTVYPGSLGR
jgi:superoxide reductase